MHLEEILKGSLFTNIRALIQIKYFISEENLFQNHIWNYSRIEWIDYLHEMSHTRTHFHTRM